MDKEGQQEEGEAEFNADDASSNPSEGASPAKPKPKRKAPISRAATERAKNWSKVEDRYLAKVFMKYRHLPSVYEVISYEDMFQERDRTPEQIERRVKYLKLHRKTHDSSDEDENDQTNSDGEQNGEQEESTEAVRESRLEKDLATLDTARPRRRLRRGADLSDEDSDDDMLLGGSTQATAEPSQSTNTGDAPTGGEPATASNAVHDEEMNAEDSSTEVQPSKTLHDDASQTQDMEDTQVLEDGIREEQSTEAEATQELDSVEDVAANDPAVSSPAPANVAAEDSAMTGVELPDATEAVTAEMEVANLNGSQEPTNPESDTADVQSLKRGRSDENADDEAEIEGTPAKKVHRTEAEEPTADASAREQ